MRKKTKKERWEEKKESSIGSSKNRSKERKGKGGDGVKKEDKGGRGMREIRK